MKVRREMGNYPENVGLKLRRGIYFTDHNLDVAQAMKAYTAAIQLAEEARMHPLSDEVLAIYTEMARLFEKIGEVQRSIDVYIALTGNISKWMEAQGHEEDMRAQRTRLLAKAVTYNTKLGELYSSEYVGDRENAEKSLVWAVETALREKQRRQTEGVRPGEGDWIDDDQMGSQLEGLSMPADLPLHCTDLPVALGHAYEEKNNHFFASQLFLQALMIKPRQDCHSVVLMNNLAAAVAQQSPPSSPGQPPPSREQLVESGRTWAMQALRLAAGIKPPLRNQECDQGCAVATHNLGEFAEMDGNIAEARDRYEEAESLANAINFPEGVANANEGLRRLSGDGRGKRKRWWS